MITPVANNVITSFQQADQVLTQSVRGMGQSLYAAEVSRVVGQTLDSERAGSKYYEQESGNTGTGGLSMQSEADLIAASLVTQNALTANIVAFKADNDLIGTMLDIFA